MGMSHWRKLWEDWSLRVVVLLTLLIQILLTSIMLSRRWRFRSSSLKVLLWFCYSLATPVVTYALGMISNQLGLINEKSAPLTEQDKLIAFWAPMLTLLLGGPDSITAYSLEDNELWKRQLLEVLGQVTGAVIIMFMAGAHSYLTYLSIALLLIACVKCGEKIWILWYASMGKLQQSMYSPNPGPNYPKFTAGYCLREDEGYHLGFHEISEIHEPMDPSTGSDYKDIVRAQSLFPSFSRLFADLILSDHDRIESMKIFGSIQSAKDAFRVVEIELHFMYERVHTKSRLLYSPWGLLVRPAFALMIFAVMVLFVFFSFWQSRWKNYSRIDLIMTIVVLALLSIQEVYAYLRILDTYAANNWRRRGEKWPVQWMIPRLSLRRSTQPRCSNQMGQFCQLNFVIRSRSAWKPWHCFLEMVDQEKAWYTEYVDISQGLKGFILSSIKKLLEQADDGLESIGDWNKQAAVDILRKHNIRDMDLELSWSMELEFDHCVLIWHIATELWCQKADDNNLPDDNMVWCRLLSRYMVYLLVSCPTMLPNGIGNIRIQDTEAEASDFFHGMKSPGFANEEFYKVKTAVEPLKVKGSMSKSVLFDGRRLESLLIVVESNQALRERKWRMIADVWFHLLIYAAKQCTGSSHAKHLRYGGELLTQVWMLMAHFGLTDHFQLKQGSVISVLRKS